MPVIEMVNIVKRFGNVVANNRVNFTLDQGEIHALLGENGAGKSTLMNVLVGMYHPNEGEIYINGKRQVVDSPRMAQKLGIGMVHQHFMLIPTLTVLENIVLGIKTNRSPFLGMSEARQRVVDLSEKFHIQVDPDALINQLTAGEQQRVEILKQLYRQARILILDEPTAVLTPQEATSLYKTLRNMAASGYSIVLITHKLEEAINWCDRIDVLRDGYLIKSMPAEGVTREELAALMVGREVVFRYAKPPAQIGAVILRIEHISASGSNKKPLLRDVSLTLHSGEIVGVAGVAGNGQSELAKVIAGLNKADHGCIYLDDRNISNCSINERTKMGISYIPDDRHRLGMLPTMNLSENLILKQNDCSPFAGRFSLNLPEIRRHAENILKNYRVIAPSPDVEISQLSGGNQQKVVLAREFELKPHVIVADQPTRGLDIGAIEYIHRLLLNARSQGLGVLLISTELEEILNLSDRILVMFGGQIVHEVTAAKADIQAIGLAMAGHWGEAA